MRTSTLFTAAFAAGAIAVPLVDKRSYVTHTAHVTVTEVVVVGTDGVPVTQAQTQAASVAEATSVAAEATSSSGGWDWSGRKHHSGSWGLPPASSEAASSAVESSAPASSAPASSAPATSEIPSVSSVVPSSTPAAAPSSTPVSSVAPTSEAPSTTQAPTSSVAASSAAGPTESYASAALHHHNIHRSNHSAPQLSWDPTLASWANQWASHCNYSHDRSIGDGQYGQNIAAGANSDNISAIITEGFYNGEVLNYLPYYDEATPSNMTAFEGFGHFTQVVWKSTTSVGCATVDCRAQGLLNVDKDVPALMTVCNYGPSGNYMGEFDVNVLKGLGQPTLHYTD